MNNVIKGLFIFAAGVAVGVIGTKKFFETKCERITQEAVDSLKEVYTYKKPESDSENESEDDPEPSPKDIANKNKYKPDILEYSNILKKEGYVKDEEDEEEVTNPYIISPDTFGDEYETVSLTYYSDGVLEDDLNGIVKNPKELVGTEYPEHFGEYEDDTVFVRNDEKQIDYEICRDHRKYSEVNDNETWAAEE